MYVEETRARHYLDTCKQSCAAPKDCKTHECASEHQCSIWQLIATVLFLNVSCSVLFHSVSFFFIGFCILIAVSGSGALLLAHSITDKFSSPSPLILYPSSHPPQWLIMDGCDPPLTLHPPL